MESYRQSICLLLALSIGLLTTGCGGGGGSDDRAAVRADAPAAAPPAAPAAPALNWSLDRVPPADRSLDPNDVDAVLDHVFTDQAVQSALLLKDGYIVGERYAPGYGAEDLGTSWSVAKSLYSSAIGVAIDEGWITSLDQRASDILTEWQGTTKEDITIRNLLEMRGGLAADTGIFYQDDQTSFAIATDLTSPPGTVFNYSNPTAQLFEPLLRRATGLDAHSYLLQKILNPIGIPTSDVGLWYDATGVNPMTYCCIDMRPENYARFGLLYSRGGEWEGTQLVSAAYVNDSMTAQSNFYGYQWWILNDSFFGRPPPITLSAAQGLDGQKIYVWPEADVVLVVLTRYQHFQVQGYVLELPDNYPDTCTGRNTCPSSVGPAVPFFDQFTLVELLAELD